MSTPETSTAAPAWTPPAIPRRTWLAFAVLILGVAMSLLDTTIVNVALPVIRESIDADEATLSWIISGYALAYGLALIPAGRIGDRVGHKWVFVVGLVVFTGASAWAGLAQDPGSLVVARVVQGQGGEGLVEVVGQELEHDLVGPDHGRGAVVAELRVLHAADRLVEAGGGGQILHRQVHEDHFRHVGLLVRAFADPSAAP